MSATLTTLAVVLATAGGPVAPRADEFQGWFEAARAGRLPIPGPVRRAARGYRYVFVAGFGNERMPGYFAQGVRELRALGVPRSAVHVVYPSSHRTIGENAAEVRDRFHEAGAAGPEDLVVIAHSRGACDTLAFALDDPTFVRDRVRALFLVQGPFGGTGLADYLTGLGPLPDARMPWRARLAVRLVATVEGYYLGRGLHGGLAELTRGASHGYWERALREHPKAAAVVGPRAFFVTSRTLPTRLHLFRRATAWYLTAYFGPNDGVVALSDQSLTGFGTVVAVLDAGHSDLTNRIPAGRSGRRLRRALVRAVVMAVGGQPGGYVSEGVRVPRVFRGALRRVWRPEGDG